MHPSLTKIGLEEEAGSCLPPTNAPCSGEDVAEYCQAAVVAEKWSSSVKLHVRSSSMTATSVGVGSDFCLRSWFRVVTGKPAAGMALGLAVQEKAAPTLLGQCHGCACQQPPATASATSPAGCPVQPRTSSGSSETCPVRPASTATSISSSSLLQPRP